MYRYFWIYTIHGSYRDVTTNLWISHSKFRLGTETKICSFTVSRISGSLWDIKLWEIFSCICFWKILPKILGVIDWGISVGFGGGGGCWGWVGLRGWLIFFWLWDDWLLLWLIQWRWRKRRTEAEFVSGGSWLYFGSEALNRLELPHKVLWTKTMTGSLLESPVYKKYWSIDGSSSMWKACIFSMFRARFVQDAWNKHVESWVTLMLPKKPWGVSSFKFGSAGVQKTNSCSMKLDI